MSEGRIEMKLEGGQASPELDGPRNDCVAFDEYPGGTEFTSPFTLGWCRFSSSDHRPLRVFNPQPPNDYGAGLAFGQEGLQIHLIGTAATQIVVNGNSGADPLQVTAHTSSGEIVDRAVISRLNRSAVLSGSGIVSVVLFDSVEALLTSVCVRGVDPGRVFDETLSEEARRNETYRRYLSEPGADDVVHRYRREFEAYYATHHEPEPPPSDDDDDDDGGGGGLGIGFDWPPDWQCVARNTALLAVTTIALTALAAHLGVPTIGELAADTAVPFLMSQFGLSANTAWLTLQIAAGTLAAYSLLKTCSER